MTNFGKTSSVTRAKYHARAPRGRAALSLYLARISIELECRKRILAGGVAPASLNSERGISRNVSMPAPMRRACEFWRIHLKLRPVGSHKYTEA